MALTISQIVASSYNAVLAEKKKAHNQWAESAFLNELDRQGGIVRKSLGPQIEAPLDYRANPAGGFQATELSPFSLTKTEFLTAAVYDLAEVVEPIVWSNKDEVSNPSENQKISLATARMSNAIDSHDDTLEQGFFATSTNGFLGWLTHATDAGTGSDGGIDSSIEVWWKNKQATYTGSSDIEATFTTVFTSCAKGSGSTLQPTLIVSGAVPFSTFSGVLQAEQRFIDSNDAKAGFKSIAFMTAKYVFSQYGTTRVFFMNPKVAQLVVSAEYFRDRRDTQPIPNATGWQSVIYTACQFTVTNRSRLGVAHL